MSNGILMVAFGEQYDHLAAHCVAYSRRFTDVPIAVITNLKTRCAVWEKCRSVDFIELDWSQDKNRLAKTTMISRTPFDKTLYLDCDVVIQKNGVEKIFDLIVDDQLLLNIYGRWSKTSGIPGGYRKAFANAGVSLPVNIYYGAISGWTRGPKTEAFFRLWSAYWEDNGCGREMPALACAVKNSGISVREIGNKDGFFTWKINHDAIIQHEYGKYVRKMVGCPGFQSYKPFDKRRAA